MSNITVKSSEARTRFRDLLDQVMAGKGDVIIERNGKSVAVLIPAEDYEQIREKLAGVRAIREAATTYEAMKSSPARINAEEGTATIPLDLYTKLVAEREARFAIIDEIRNAQEDRPIEEVERDVAEAIARVRGQNAASGD
jgi:prevent-host-death family protein